MHLERKSHTTVQSRASRVTITALLSRQSVGHPGHEHQFSSTGISLADITWHRSMSLTVLGDDDDDERHIVQNSTHCKLALLKVLAFRVVHGHESVCHMHCICVRVVPNGVKKRIFLRNSCVKLHAKICTLCWNDNKSHRGRGLLVFLPTFRCSAPYKCTYLLTYLLTLYSPCM